MGHIRRHVPFTLATAGLLALSTMLVPHDDGAEGGVLDPATVERLGGVFVNDDAGEVGDADIVDGTLTGGDVSTQRGDVFHTNGMLTVSGGTHTAPAILALGSDTNAPGGGMAGPGLRAVGGDGLFDDDFEDLGGHGIEAVGGVANADGPDSGNGVVATGGSGAWRGGHGVFAQGGTGVFGNGDGVVARGGSEELLADAGAGVGVDAEGGFGTVGGNGAQTRGGFGEFDGGYGLVADGGDATTSQLIGDGGTGARGTGGDGTFFGGNGIEGQGGDGGFEGGDGVVGVGGSPGGVGVVGSTAATAGLGVLSLGDLGVAGTLRTVQPHPTDASLEIRLAPLSGNEAGTYFRGSAQVVGGSAVIVPPEDFRLATGAEGLTVHLTPVGGPALLWVESKSLDGIVVRASDDVAFDFVVSGLRRGFEAMETVAENRTFVPQQRGVPYGTQYTEAYQELLIDNGTLHDDLTPRESTAVHNGWNLSDPEDTP